jgi:hypothetical protein
MRSQLFSFEGALLSPCGRGQGEGLMEAKAILKKTEWIRTALIPHPDPLPQGERENGFEDKDLGIHL